MVNLVLWIKNLNIIESLHISPGTALNAQSEIRTESGLADAECGFSKH